MSAMATPLSVWQQHPPLMWQKLLLLSSLAVALEPTLAVQQEIKEPLVVELPDGSGKVEGLDLRDGATGSFEVNAFLGMPFAQPPTKTRRWTSPVKNLPWKGTRPAKHFAPNCMQLDPPAWGTMRKNVSEDCLYLNVWTPAQEEGEQKDLTYPVMVFIHGGGYAYGGAYDTELDGSSLCDLADVVVVTIQYRVDIFGWLGSDQLRARSEDNSTGNWGAQDQRMALQWVQNNIAAFHGNVNQTVIFGESAGAGSVSNHVAMRKSWGLFQGAISQSGGFQRWVAKPLADAEKNYASVTEALGCGTGAAAVECLVGKTAAELLAHSEAVRLPSTDGWDSCQWSPVIDGVELQKHPMDLLKSGRVAPGIKLILGTNKDEGTSFLGYVKFGLDPLTPKYDMDEGAFRNWTANAFGKNFTTPLLALYPVVPKTEASAVAAPPGSESYKDYFTAATNVISDYMMWCPNRRFARWHSVNNPGENSTYVYVFSEEPGIKHTREGVFHGAEIRFTFFAEDELVGWDEKALSLDIVRYWTNFAATQNPNVRPLNGRHAAGRAVEPDKVWAPFQPTGAGVGVDLRLPHLTATHGRHSAQCDFWDRHPN